MTVTRRIEITYDAPSEDEARAFERGLGLVITDASMFYDITGQAFSSEPVIPSPETLVGPHGD